MPRYIDADLIPFVESEFGSFDDFAYRYDIDEIPTADVEEVRHGEWVSHEGYEECGECRTKAIYPHNYCPNCGAKMDGGQTE